MKPDAGKSNAILRDKDFLQIYFKFREDVQAGQSAKPGPDLVLNA